ncbi:MULTISPECIES: Ig-like domain-containing protein [unclassified Microbacterium]|uniref:Ig-like domain-containing protein n=1 Tax=unclassified Microbacterium TaxID=2609290 RepID=UPI00214D02A6|nr:MULTISPECIES: Ig-like domain-containing protein [unclassified Microbacterium]MCR2808812.1 Ig-like domain-containing protein [Microbacterium sp. zg.B185]WIM18766.1 Ig-like domain-containing protein [Microbacterium sp. zg-B185]
MKRRTAAGLMAAAVALALVAGVSVVWPGLDARQTEKTDTSVWALQTGEGRRYARVNTSVGELDTVRTVSNPSQVTQTAEGAYLFSDSFSKLTRIDSALPADLDEDAVRASPSTPPGTVDVAIADDFVAYLTDSGAVHVGRLSTGSATQVDLPAEGESGQQYTSDAIAIDTRGVLFSYSLADGTVLEYDTVTGQVRARNALDPDGIASPAITAAGDAWVVVDTSDGEVWVDGADAAVPAPVGSSVVLGQPDPAGTAVYLADDAVLLRVPVDGSAISTEMGGGGSVLGTPARPVVHDGEVFAAWLPQTGAGALWGSRSGDTVLDYGGQPLSDSRRPAFVASDDAIILNETRSGWVWTVPDGELVASSQDWTLDEQTDPDAAPSDEQLAIVLDPQPPVAVPDAFGVRAGSLATLPVLMNDHDPNEDVLSIEATLVTGLDPGFGTVSITDDSQRLTVSVAPGATGTAQFTYAVSDGTAETGLLSSPATVVLTVSDGDAAPQWCGVESCLVPWPTPEVAVGGTVTVPVLPGWVDPDGDPLLLLSVENRSGVGMVAATPGGDLVYQHSDAGGVGEEVIELGVTVADTTGQATTMPLSVRVSTEPALTVQSFAVVDTIDAGLTVDVAPHVTGTAGQISLDSVRVLDDAAATATVVGGSASFDFTASTPGTFLVGFTVTDGTTLETGTARITLLPSDAPAQLATSPVVAFVHPQEDATLDVLLAVSNPTRRVLLLSDVEGRADDGATLSVDAVGQNFLRVSGSTASGAPGRLGTVTYTVSDGTEDQGAQVTGQATVYLLPPAPALAPIAVDDTVVVRAGAQIDIPVLENDIAPAGGRPTLDPASIASSTPQALAFSSGDVLRYLAPPVRGDYTVSYRVSATGAPGLADEATVRVRVLPDEANRAPLPKTLEGRVLSGESTVIDFDDFGMDPDGDVVSLDRILTQPDSGSATISADGESIVYASVPGDSGQVSFRYRVVDAFGGTGEGVVRLGVLDSTANPSPITFTDYVQVQAGATSTIRVSPLANDVDPTMGALEVTGVRPDVPATLGDGDPNPEYDRLAERLKTVGESTVVIAAGTQPGTMSFLYDVESSSGNTGRGLIVVQVVRESVPNYPRVDDTVLTAETREDFRSGVDVLSGRAAWSGGDVEELTVSLWGSPSDVTVDGWELSGALPETTRVIPFAVTGEGPDGEVTTYAFLRVPGDEDLSLALRANAASPEVDELGSVAFDMAALVAAPRGSDLEVGGDLRPSGARAAATCTVESGTTVRYDAGAGAPWTDACRVPVRLSGQTDWTYLSVPIIVRPLDPQPELRAGSMSVGPGETATFDLRNMTTWQLREDWSGIRYAVDYTGSTFEVSLSGSIVTVVGADRAVPGAEEAAVVSVSSHAAVLPVRLILRVGAAPSALPQGGAVTQQCSQAAGSSCTIPVIGASGEVNPLPRTPLTVIDARTTGACAGISFRVASPTAVVASWSPDAPGTTCSASFSVQDAQGRRTNGERDGQILLDLQGYPKAPASVRQIGFSDGALTLRVDPGEARQAYPGLNGFVIRWNGAEVAQCSADGTCPSIAAPNGERREYEAYARNSVGASRAGVRVIAWAYDSPVPPGRIEVRPVVTNGDGGVVSLLIDGIDPDKTAALQITSPAGETTQVSIGRRDTSVQIRQYRVGSNTLSPITVTPYSRFDVPPGLGGTPSGASTTAWGNGIGAPTGPTLTLSSTAQSDGTSTVTAQAGAGSGGDGSTLRYGIVREGQPCTATADGGTASFPGLTDGEEYSFTMCAESWFEGDRYGRATTTATARAEQSGAAPTGYTFAVDAAPDVSDGRAVWLIRSQPTSDERIPNRNVVEFSGLPSSAIGSDPGIQVRYVHERWGTATPWAPVTPRAGSAPYQVQATWSLQTCVGGSDLVVTGDSSADAAGGKAAISFSTAGLRYLDALGAVLPHPIDTWSVPLGAVRVEGIAVTVDWSAQGWGLAPATATLSASCAPNLPLPPLPTP